MSQIIRLRNDSEKTINHVVTRVPLSASQKSPNPDLVKDPSSPTKKIPNPALLTAVDDVVIKPGETVEFSGGEEKAYNIEQAEYLYQMLGQPENGGSLYPGGPAVRNKNFLLEVDEKGAEIKDNLYVRFTRGQRSAETAQNIKLVEKEA